MSSSEKICTFFLGMETFSKRYFEKGQTYLKNELTEILGVIISQNNKKNDFNFHITNNCNDILEPAYFVQFPIFDVKNALYFISLNTMTITPKRPLFKQRFLLISL